ncbi:MAG: transcriptional repressor LexA [Clostridia bacterium]|nr:transcriptional repressor LexA [Clostridia bacterium]
MRAAKISEKEKAIYDYINETIAKEGYSPTVRDIQSALGIKSTSTVHAYLNRLEEKGMIRKDPGKSRTLKTAGSSRESRNTARVPLLGSVRAGMPILAVENYEGYIDYPLMNHSYGANELFALRVKGESMIDAGILDGDIIIVKKESCADNGTIVVALVEDSATVKTFYKENGHFRLQPENPTMDPIIVDEVFILGRVVANFRFY